MAKKLFSLMYNPEKFRIRGSFVNIVTTSLMWAINIFILALVWRQVYYEKETLSSLSMFLSVWLTFVEASYVYITTVYINNKAKLEIEERRFGMTHASQAANLKAPSLDTPKDQEYEK